MTAWQCIRSLDPRQRPERSGCARQSAARCFLEGVEQLQGQWHQGRRRTSLSIVDAGNVVHAARDEEDAVWRPCEVVDLGAYGPAHGLDAPRLLVLEAFFEVCVRRLVLGGDPEQDVAVVARAREHFACRC